jgi:hypothetical protein
VKQERRTTVAIIIWVCHLETEEGADNDDYRSLYIHAIKSPIIQERHQKRLDKFFELYRQKDLWINNILDY